MNKFDIIIIGAGPAGLFTCLSLNTKGKKVLLLEKNSVPGKKLLISGKGQCNITNSEDINNFHNHYGDNFRFLKNALKNYTNDDLIKFLNSNGLETVTREDGKVFPKSLKASDFVNTLVTKCKDNNVIIKYNSNVEAITYKNDNYNVILKDKKYITDYLVITTGGKSYPVTGSTGEGYKFAKMVGHSLIKPKEALTPVIINNYQFKELSGISLNDIKFSIWREGKKIKNYRGDILFTHTGLSGPGIINNSRYIMPNDEISLCLIHYENEDDFRKEFLSELSTNGKMFVTTFLKKYDLPKRLLFKILEQEAISEKLLCSNIKKKQRNAIIKSLLSLRLKVNKLGGYHLAMVTSGGIPLNEINSKTMESKKNKGLYFAGEVIDIDGDTGGYNIQAAISTATLVAKDLNEK